MAMAPSVTLSIAIVGVILASWFTSTMKGICVSESLVVPDIFETQITVDPCRVFSDSYAEARTKFREAAAATANCELHALTVAQNYTIDVAVLKGTLPGLVVHTSGVHGIEGFAGSAVQIAFLEELPAEQQLPTIIFIHAFNPVGMAHYRRTNEHNVDLNRNALTADQWKMYAENHYNRKDYERFDEYLFNPSRAPTWWAVRVEFWVRAVIYIRKYGLSTLKAAMVGGQYHKPEGIFYGGSETELSIRLVEDFIKDYLANHEALETQAVTWIDVHTGLGKAGEDTLMTAPKSSIWPAKDAASELNTWFPESQSPFDESNSNTASVVHGYTKVKGITADYYERLFTLQQKPLLAVQEFGTVPSVLVGHALVIENMAYHYSGPNDSVEWARQTTRRAFYPSSKSWRNQVLTRGLRVLLKAAKRSSQLSAAS